MGIFYEMSGQVQIKPEHMDEAEKIAEEFNDNSTSDMEAYVEEGIFYVSGGVHTSYSGAEELDQIVLKLSPLALPGYIRYKCDDERGKLYIGDPALEKAFKSARSLEKFKDKIVEDLLPEDIGKLLIYLTS